MVIDEPGYAYLDLVSRLAFRVSTLPSFYIQSFLQIGTSVRAKRVLPPNPSLFISDFFPDREEHSIFKVPKGKKKIIKIKFQKEDLFVVY